jgi:hypothetical protein
MAAQDRAAKVTPPRKRATKPTAAAAELIEPTPVLPDKQPANTRTSTRGGAARTATRPRSRTEAAATTVEPEIPPTTPTAPSAADAPPTPDDGEVEDLPEADVEWNGRTWRVRLPSLEQLTIYRRLNAQFQEIGIAQAKPDAAPMSLDQATKYFDRALKLITSILVNSADIEWLEDEMLEGRLTLTKASGLMREAFEKLAEVSKAREAENENRAARRARARLAD